jgi:hypothetical protein
MAATVLFWGIANRKGGGSLLRNFSRAMGLPRGANEGLEEVEGGSGSRLEMPWESSPPSP